MNPILDIDAAVSDVENIAATLLALGRGTTPVATEVFWFLGGALENAGDKLRQKIETA